MILFPMKVVSTLGVFGSLVVAGTAQSGTTPAIPLKKAEFTHFAKLVAPNEASALERKDTAFFDRLYAPEFKTKNEHGVMDGKKIAMFMLRYHFNTLDKVSCKVKILSLEATKTTGAVKLMTVLNGVTKSHGAKIGSPIKVTRLEKQTFVKKGDQWLMSLDEDLQKPVVLTPAYRSMGAMKLTPARH